MNELSEPMSFKDTIIYEINLWKKELDEREKELNKREKELNKREKELNLYQSSNKHTSEDRGDSSSASSINKNLGTFSGTTG